MKNPKRKGNSFERLIAKILGKVIYGDENMLNRHPTSGMLKEAWVGDIFPQKQLPEGRIFPFYIETKTGYKKDIPTFYNYRIIRKWLDSCIENSNSNQKIILLICRFKHKKILMISSDKFFEPDITIRYGDRYFYVYDFDEVISNPKYLIERTFSKNASR